MKRILFASLGAIILITPVVSLASIDDNLKYGSRGSAVTELQEFLISKGFLSGQVSGSFFSLTQKAVIAYQNATGIPATGFVGPMTRVKINDELSQANASSATAEIAETGTTTPLAQSSLNTGIQQQIQDLLKQLAAIQEQFKQQKASQVQQQQGSTQSGIGESIPVPNIDIISVIKKPEYEFKILSFEPVYDDIDYETPPNKAINHYKVKVQFDDKNNVISGIEGNLKIFFENKLFQGQIYSSIGKYPLSNVLVYDNFQESETRLSNPFIFEYALSRFPKNKAELNNYFLTAIYKDQRYRIYIGEYFNFEHISECDSVISDFYNDLDVKRILSYYRDAPTEPITKYKNLIKEKQCYKSLRYEELRSCVANFAQNGYSGCEVVKENALN